MTRRQDDDEDLRLDDEGRRVRGADGRETAVDDGHDQHPVGSTTGTGTGATIGAVAGMALAGPPGAIVAGAVGGIIGGLTGHGVAAVVNPKDDGDDHLDDRGAVVGRTSTAGLVDDRSEVRDVRREDEVISSREEQLDGIVVETRIRRA